MKKLTDEHFKDCCHTGHFNSWSKKRLVLLRLIRLPGFLALNWMLIRIIPKPSRSRYPGRRMAFPMVSALASSLAGLIIFQLGFCTNQKWFSQSKYLWGVVGAFITIAGMFVFFHGSPSPLQLRFKISLHPPNQPIGQAQGIFTGRVVWVYDPDATHCSSAQNYILLE